MPRYVHAVSEGTQYQNTDEIITWAIDVTNIGSSPTSPVVIVTDETGTDVTATVMPVNSPSVAGNVITLSPLKSLTAQKAYTVLVRYVLSGNTLESEIPVWCAK